VTVEKIRHKNKHAAITVGLCRLAVTVRLLEPDSALIGTTGNATIVCHIAASLASICKTKRGSRLGFRALILAVNPNPNPPRIFEKPVPEISAEHPPPCERFIGMIGCF
jgi:hypothetical protein